MEIPARAAASGQSTTPVITTTGTGPCTSCMYQALRASHFPSVPCLILRNSRMNSISVLVSRSCDGIFHTLVVWCNTFWFRALQNLQGPPSYRELILITTYFWLMLITFMYKRDEGLQTCNWWRTCHQFGPIATLYKTEPRCISRQGKHFCTPHQALWHNHIAFDARNYIE